MRDIEKIFSTLSVLLPNMRCIVRGGLLIWSDVPSASHEGFSVFILVLVLTGICSPTDMAKKLDHHETEGRSDASATRKMKQIHKKGRKKKRKNFGKGRRSSSCWAVGLLGCSCRTHGSEEFFPNSFLSAACNPCARSTFTFIAPTAQHHGSFRSILRK